MFRARIILKCDSGLSNSEVAAAVRTTPFTVGFWRNRFIQNGGVSALWDEPRPGAPRKIGDEKVEAVIKATLESKPQQGGAKHVGPGCFIETDGRRF